MKFSFNVILIFLLIFIFHKPVHAQYYWQWWNSYHNWDGQKPQESYVKRSPQYMGPNALPVQAFRGTKIGYRTYFQSGVDYHFSKEEYAINPYFHLYFPIQKNRIAFEMYTRPIEYYKTNNRLRDERYMRDSIPSGYSKGDTYFATRIRIWENFYRLPDLTLEVTLKTTTGKNLENARHINAPAYTFNGVFGNYIKGSDTAQIKLKWFLLAGTFIWQEGDNGQNDSFLYGGGLEFQYKRVSINCNAGGYRGYKKIGDRPIVARVFVQYEYKKIDFAVNYQRGFQNMISNSINLSLRYKIGFFDKINKY